MTAQAHVLVAVLALATIGFILRLVRRRALRAKYSVLWVSIGVGLAVLVSWPGVLVRLADAVGVETPALLFLLLALCFLLVLSLHFSYELSRLEERTRTLAEECAILRSELAARDAVGSGTDVSGLDASDPDPGAPRS